MGETASISTFASLVPFVDCSAHTENFPNLSEDEKKICFQTAQFEDFLVEFLNRCFTIVENSAVQQIRTETSADDTNFSREDNMKDVGMASTFSAILMQCSEKLYDVALKKVSSWLNLHCLRNRHFHWVRTDPRVFSFPSHVKHANIRTPVARC